MRQAALYLRRLCVLIEPRGTCLYQPYDNRRGARRSRPHLPGSRQTTQVGPQAAPHPPRSPPARSRSFPRKPLKRQPAPPSPAQGPTAAQRSASPGPKLRVPGPSSLNFKFRRWKISETQVFVKFYTFSIDES